MLFEIQKKVLAAALEEDYATILFDSAGNKKRNISSANRWLSFKHRYNIWRRRDSITQVKIMRFYNQDGKVTNYVMFESPDWIICAKWASIGVFLEQWEKWLNCDITIFGNDAFHWLDDVKTLTPSLMNKVTPISIVAGYPTRYVINFNK